MGLAPLVKVLPRQTSWQTEGPARPGKTFGLWSCLGLPSNFHGKLPKCFGYFMWIFTEYNTRQLRLLSVKIFTSVFCEFCYKWLLHADRNTYTIFLYLLNEYTSVIVHTRLFIISGPFCWNRCSCANNVRQNLTRSDNNVHTVCDVTTAWVHCVCMRRTWPASDWHSS